MPCVKSTTWEEQGSVLGDFFRLNQSAAPNAFCFEHRLKAPPGICTQAQVRLHPSTADEEGLIIPFETFEEALQILEQQGRLPDYYRNI